MLFVLALGPAWAVASDRVVSARLEGAPADDADAARAVIEQALGRVPDDGHLAAITRDLERVAGVGSVRVRRRHQADGVHVVFAHDGAVRRVADVAYVVDGERLDAVYAARWHRRLDATTGGLFLAAGTRFHPFLLGLDEAALQAWCADRGYRGARVRSDVSHGDGLTTITWHLDRGAPYEVISMRVEGASGLDRVPRLRVGDPISPRVVEHDVRRLRSHLCRDGYPRTRVRVRETPALGESARRGVGVRYVVDRGVRIVAGPVQVAGRNVPVEFVEALPLVEGGPYCPELVEESAQALKAHLRNTGVPDPSVRVHERTWLDPEGRRINSVTFDIRWLSSADVERIWFDGNRVTRTDVLEQMLAIAPGERYQQQAVDASVQAMRRSGLFRRVSVEVVPGSRPDRVYLIFRLVERDALGFDVVDQQLIVFNVDVAHWPDDFADFETGQPFRGAGQRLDAFGQSKFQAVRWRDDFLTRHLVTRLGFERSLSSNAGFEEEWLNASGGFGVKALEGAFRAVLFAEVEWTFTDQAADVNLPVLDGDALTTAAGLDLEIDLSSRDDERVEFLGIEFEITGRAGRSVEGADFQWADLTSRARAHLPLWRTSGGQHFVLRTTARLRSVFADSEGRLQAHQRLFPSARGYSSKSIGVEFDLGDGDALELGGLHALDGAVEIRIPLPFGRRNALSPFAEVAAVSDTRTELLDDVYPTAGLAFAFSFFSERLEGVVWGAWGFRDEAEAGHEYVGGALGGNF